MAVQRRVNWISQERIDLPALRSVESAASNDWDQGVQAIITNTTQGYIIRGFEISISNAIGGASNALQLEVDPGAVLHIAASQSGTVMMVPSGTQPQTLNSATNSNVTGSFASSSTNYIGLDYTRYLDPATNAQTYIWDPTLNAETTMIAPTGDILTFEIVITTTAWAANILPIAIVTTDINNNVLTITDCRWLLNRLGTGGANPNPFYVYPWTAQSAGRTENPGVASSTQPLTPFEGGDKMLFSLKDWMNAIMSNLLEIKGTNYWYSLSPAGSITKLREDLGNTISSGAGVISHGILPNVSPVASTTGSITSSSNQLTVTSSIGIAAGQYIFGTGIPYNTTVVSIASNTVTMSNNATATNASISVSFYAANVITEPGQINWDQPIYLKVVGSNLAYELSANLSTTDVTLEDGEIAYITLSRDISITPNLFYSYNGSGPNTTTVASLGNVAWANNLLAGDFIRAEQDADAYYTEILTVSGDYTSVTIQGNYVPNGQTSAGVQSVYALGTYNPSASPSTARDIYIADRNAVPMGQNVYWLFSREDNGGSTPKAYIRFTGTELAQGDTDAIDDGVPRQLLNYIGSPSESSSNPQYVSALNPGSIQEIVSATTGDYTTVASNQYFYIYSSANSRQYYVWVNLNGTGVDPKPLYVGTPLEWVVSNGQTASQLASNLATLLNSTFYDDFTAVASGPSVTITNNSAGSCNSPVNINVGAPFTISSTQVGTGVGNYAINDGDNLTVAIKKLDQAIGTIVSGMDQVGYDETVSIVSSGATPPTSLTGPIAANTQIQLPPNSRQSDIQVYYAVGAGKLEVFLNGQKLIVNNDYDEVGVSGAASDYIEILFELVIGDVLEFTFAGGGGGSGGGEVGPPGPQGPQGIPGEDALNGPINISQKTSNYSVMTSDGFLLANCASNSITFTLPTAASMISKCLYFKKIDSTSNSMTIQGFGSDIIDSANTLSTTVQYEAFSMVSDGTQWWLF